MASKKKPIKKAVEKKTVKKSAKKAAAKKTLVNKAPVKKVAVKKIVAKKASVKKAAGKKSSIKKAAKKAVPKKTIAKRAIKKSKTPTSKKAVAKKAVKKSKPGAETAGVVVIPQPETMPPVPITNADIETGLVGDDVIIIPHPTREIPVIPEPVPEEGHPCICRKIGAFFFCMKQLPSGSLIQCDGPFETMEECQEHRCLT